MSKLYKDLKYDTDRVMQPGDPVTSFDSNTAIKAGNATGKGFIETYGEPVAYSYEVTVDIPQVPGASCRVRIDDTCNTTMDITILDISGWPGATASGSDILVNGSNWGHFSAGTPYDEPLAAIIPTETSDTYNTVIYCYHGNDNSQPCTSWSNLVKTRQMTSKEISTVGHTHGLIQTSDGTTKVKAVNTGKGFIETYGDAIDHYYDVTVDIPQVSGASARIRLKDVDDTLIDVAILSIEGFPGAEIDNDTPSRINLNGASWGYVNCNPAWEGSSYPDYTIIPIGYGGRICVKVNSEYCHWSDLEQTRQLVSSKEIITAAEETANKVLASPSSGSGAVSFRSLVAADIPNLNTSKLTEGVLGVARGGTGRGANTLNSVLVANGTTTTGTIQNVASASGAFYSTGTNVRPQFGTLPVAQGGTGATTTSAALAALGAAAAEHEHSQLYIGTTDTNARLVINTSGDAYVDVNSPGAGGSIRDPEARGSSRTTVVQLLGQVSNVVSQQPNKVLAGPSSGSNSGAISFRSLVAADIPNLDASKITSGTLAIAQGGTGSTSASTALTALGAASTSDATINLQFSDWSFDTTPLEGHYTVTFYEDMDGEGTPGWQFLWYDQYGSVLSSGDVYTSDRNATYLDFSTYTPSRPGVIEHVIATRSLIGYRLGPVDGLNPDKHLAMANHTHSSLTDGTYTASIPALSSNEILALDGHTHPTVSITYSELVSLRNGSQLIPGMTYRITDYTTTTTQTDTQSAGHDFDVLVIADGINTINENARAIMHETISEFDPTEQYSIGDYVKQQNATKKFTKNYTGTFDSNTTYHNQDVVYYNDSYYQVTADQTSGVSWADLSKAITSISNFLTADSPYFSNCKLEAWKIKYCLDNDATRFAWADTSNGKGVIYEMEDEWGNRCGYDFKNIQFKRYKITGITSTRLTGYTLTDLQSALVYSSSSKGYMALSTSMSIYGCDSVNVDSTSYQWCYTFSTSITDPSDASLNGSSRLNRIGSYINETGTKYTLNNIVMRGKNLANEIDVNCYNMTFKGALTRCHISDHCSNFTMGGGGYSYIGSACDNIVLSGNALTAGRDLHIGSSCSNIVSGLRLQKTTIGSGCKYISLGRYVMYCNIGAACQYIHFGSSTESKSYYEAVTIEPENQYIYLDCTGSTSTSAYYKNVTIGKGVNNTTTWKTITDANTNQNYETTYQAENSLVIPV